MPEFTTAITMLAVASMTTAGFLVSSPAEAAPVTTSSRPAASAVSPHPVASTVVSVSVPQVRGTSRAAGSATAAPGGLRVGAAMSRSGVSFDVAGVAFTGKAPPGLLIEVRTHTAAGWGAWYGLDLDGDGPDPGSAEALRSTTGSAPLLAAGSDAIGVRVSSPSGAVPAGLTARLIDGGTSSADAGLPGPRRHHASHRARHRARHRGGLDLGLDADDHHPGPVGSRREHAAVHPPNTLTGFKAAVVHHTVNSNTYTYTYTSAQAASLMRGIYAYHR